MMVKGVSEEGKDPVALSLPPSPVAGTQGPKGIPISSLLATPGPASSRSPFSPAAQCSIVGRLRGPQRCPHPNLQNLWMSPYNSKIDFVAAMIPMAMSWGDYPGFSQWVQCHHRGPHKREAGRSGGAMWSQKQRSEWYRARNQTMRWPLEAGKRQEMASPFLLAEKAASPANSLIWVRGEWLWTSDFQYCEVINACCFKFVVICYSSSGRLIHQDKVNLISSEAWISFVDKDPLLNFVSIANL